MSSSLALHFLGTPQLFLDNNSVTTKRRKAVALLAYLAVERRQHTRETLSALLWPDYEQSKAFTNLRHTLWEIKQSIGQGWLDADRDKIGLNNDANIWLDVAQFKAMLNQSRTQKDTLLRISLLADSAQLYRSHFLTGFSLKDAYPFNEWAYVESEDLRLKLANALTMLSEDHCSLNEAEKAIPYARRLITIDPLNEAAHRLLMDVYIQAGQHSAALKQYQTLEQTLRKELGLDPQPETYALYKKIRKGEIHVAAMVKPTEIVTPKHNLPHHLSSFIGREKEQIEVTNLLAKNRLVTLVGPGGIGKTSLSLQVGQKLLGKYPNGVWFIALDSLSDAKLVPQTVASVFDIREGTERLVVETLTNVLREKTTLLILDNCEHLLGACAELATSLLTNCPKLKILATTREVLNVTGEATYQVSSLSMPEYDDTSFEKLTDYESIRLFNERATLALSTFALTKDNAQTVIDICRKVDGIPLAIELAAARVNILQVEEILNQLNDSFALLTSDSRASSERHQTLQASMDWDWGLLDTAEQVFLQQLSVFAGGWTLEAAQAVCDDDVLGLTDSLVKKSLVMVNQESGSKTRYRFHEIIRQYVREKLIELSEEENIRTRHLKYFLRFSEQAELALKGPAQIEWYARVTDERDNIRSALKWADKTDAEAGLFISGRLWRFWEDFDLREGEGWLRKFLAKSESHHLHARAKALYAYGIILYLTMQYDLLGKIAEECLAIYRAIGDPYGEIDGLIVSSRFYFAKNDTTQTMELMQQALVLAESLGDTWRIAFMFGQLGWGSGSDNNCSQRLHYFQEAVSLFRKVGDLRELQEYLGSLGNYEILSGNLESAQRHLAEAVQLSRNSHYKGAMHFLSALARMESIRGNFQEARELLEKSIENSARLGFRNDHLWNRIHLGHLIVHQGQAAEAREIFLKTTREFFKDTILIGVCYSLEGMAGVYVVIGNPEHAARLIGWADATRGRISETRPYMDQVDVDKDIAVIIAKIGSSAFEDAYASGREMTMDEAVGLALKEN